MSELDPETILQSINASLKSKKLYPKGHPAASAPVKKSYELLTESLRSRNNVALGIVNEALVFEGKPIVDSEQLYPELLSHLAHKKVEAVIFEKGFTEKEISSIFDILSGEDVHGAELQKILHAQGIMHITLKSIPTGMVEVYKNAVEAVKNVMNEIRMGKIPKAEPVRRIVDQISESVFSDPNAMIGLTMIKNYDNYLYNHSVNVSIVSLALGRALGLSEEELHAIGVASLLHDVGKTGVSEDIIRKPGGLSSEEWEKVKEHPTMGSKIIQRMDGVEELIGKMVFEHHIKYDRSGYPKTDEDLHPLSQVITICDAYDALTTLRVYQTPHNPVEAIKIMMNLSGRHFHPDMLKAFISMIGLYPVGTMVRLSTSEIAIVTKANDQSPDAPTVKVIYDTDGNSLDNPVEIDLSNEESKEVSIIATINPATADVELSNFFEGEAGG